MEDQVGQIQFSFSVKTEGARTTQDTPPQYIVVSIDDESGTTVLEDEAITLSFIDQNYLTEPISLDVGDYLITKFLVLDADSVVNYASPLEDSELAYLVEDPLPLGFEINFDEVVQLSPEVISTEERSVSDFGYGEFVFEIVETFDVLLATFVYNSETDGHDLTESSLSVHADGDSLTYQNPFAATNILTLPDRYDSFTFFVEKDGYTTFEYAFSADSIKSFQGNNANGPLEIVLYEDGELSQGLIAYYPFNGNADDESGNGNDGTINGATLIADRNNNPNSAYSFDGIDDYIDLGGNTLFNLSAYNEFSVSVWVNPVKSDVGRNETIFSKYSSNGDHRSYLFQYIDPTNVSLTIHENGELSNFDRAEATIDNDWHQIVWIYSNGEVNIFVDGTLSSSTEFTISIYESRWMFPQ